MGKKRAGKKWNQRKRGLHFLPAIFCLLPDRRRIVRELARRKSPFEASRRFSQTADGLISDPASVAVLNLWEVLQLGHVRDDLRILVSRAR